MNKVAAEDYYALLGVSEKVGDAELRRVWRRLAKLYHPDHAGPHATVSFQRISAAYAVLCDPVARASYDRRRRESMPAQTATPERWRRAAPPIMLSRLTGPLAALLACGNARRLDGGVIELFLNPTEANQGGMITISMRVPVRCKKCRGAPSGCAQCDGRGWTDELFSAWLAVPPQVPDGAVLLPSVSLPGMVQPVRFVIRKTKSGPRA